MGAVRLAGTSGNARLKVIVPTLVVVEIFDGIVPMIFIPPLVVVPLLPTMNPLSIDDTPPLAEIIDSTLMLYVWLAIGVNCHRGIVPEVAILVELL